MNVDFFSKERLVRLEATQRRRDTSGKTRKRGKPGRSSGQGMPGHAGGSGLHRPELNNNEGGSPKGREGDYLPNAALDPIISRRAVNDSCASAPEEGESEKREETARLGA